MRPWSVAASPSTTILSRTIMRDLGLEPCQPKPGRFPPTEQDGQAGPIPDLVNRDFTASKPGERMVRDIT